MPAADVALAERKVTQIRGVRYDITDFLDRHPGGRRMLDFAVGRDATIMFESAHVRSPVAEAALRRLPLAAPGAGSAVGFDAPGGQAGEEEELFPTPGKSELFQVIRRRVAKEVLKGGPGRGVPWWHAGAVIVTWPTAAAIFTKWPGIASGALLGWALAWIGTGVQHSANHGSLTNSPRLNYLIGLLNDLGPGGSSLHWRYHHQVSHHAYTNDIVRDQDVHSSYPLIRLDKEQPLEWYHKYQWLYGPAAFPLIWASIQLDDISALLNKRAHLVDFRGTSWREAYSGLLLKAAHLTWLFAVPWRIHGMRTMLLPWGACLSFGGAVLAWTFVVSHNLEQSKNDALKPKTLQDWGALQVETAASWGGRVSSFFTGGLSLQIEHHLFPCVGHSNYADIQPIVKEECEKHGVRYVCYDGWTALPQIAKEMVSFLWKMGQPESAPTGKMTEAMAAAATAAATVPAALLDSPQTAAGVGTIAPPAKTEPRLPKAKGKVALPTKAKL